LHNDLSFMWWLVQIVYKWLYSDKLLWVRCNSEVTTHLSCWLWKGQKPPSSTRIWTLSCMYIGINPKPEFNQTLTYLHYIYIKSSVVNSCEFMSLLNKYISDHEKIHHPHSGDRTKDFRSVVWPSTVWAKGIPR
jgi:hypothetical protein